MTHEVIGIEAKDASTVHILVGTVTDVDTVNNKVDVNIDDYGNFADISVFYHCENSQTSDGMPFLRGERVIIVNSGDAVNLSVADMKVIGFEDGLPRLCGILCEDIEEENLGIDIASSLSYEIDYNSGQGSGVWTDDVVTDNSTGLKIVRNNTTCDYTTGNLPTVNSYLYILSLKLSESIDLREGWYYLSYNFNVVLPVTQATITPTNEWECPSDASAEILCTVKFFDCCRFKGFGTKKLLDWDPELEDCIYTIPYTNDCGNAYSGTYKQCIELTEASKGISINDIALNIKFQIYCGAYSNDFRVEFELTNADIQISSLSLKKIKRNIKEPGIYIESDCNEDNSCVSPATWGIC